MNRISKTRLGAGIGLMVGSSTVWAGATAGIIVYSPDVQSVPALSGWMLIILAMLLGVIAYRVMSQKHGRTLAILAATGIVAAGASTGIKLIEDAHAAGATIPLDITPGSSASIPLGLARFENTTNVLQRVRSITYTQGCGPSAQNPASPVCTVSLAIQPQAWCWLDTSCQFQASDRRLKENIQEVGRDANTGLALYQFNYIGDPAKRFQGVMADEVEEFMPSAVFTAPSGLKSVNYKMLGIEFKQI